MNFYMKGNEKFQEVISLIAMFCPILGIFLGNPAINIIPIIAKGLGIDTENVDELHAAITNSPDQENTVKSIQDKYLETCGYVKK